MLSKRYLPFIFYRHLEYDSRELKQFLKVFAYESENPVIRPSNSSMKCMAKSQTNIVKRKTQKVVLNLDLLVVVLSSCLVTLYAVFGLENLINQ